MQKAKTVDLIVFSHIAELCAIQHAVHSIITVSRNVTADVCAHRIMARLVWSVEHVFQFFHHSANGIE